MDSTPYVWKDHISSYGDGDVCVVKYYTNISSYCDGDVRLVKYYTYVPAKNQTDRKIELSGYGTARHHPTDRPDDVTAKTLAAVRALKDLAKNLAKNLEDYARSRVDYNDSVREKARKTQQAALERIRERKSIRNSI